MTSQDDAAQSRRHQAAVRGPRPAWHQWRLLGLPTGWHPSPFRHRFHLVCRQRDEFVLECEEGHEIIWAVPPRDEHGRIKACSLAVTRWVPPHRHRHTLVRPEDFDRFVYRCETGGEAEWRWYPPREVWRPVPGGGLGCDGIVYRVEPSTVVPVEHDALRWWRPVEWAGKPADHEHCFRLLEIDSGQIVYHCLICREFVGPPHAHHFRRVGRVGDANVLHCQAGGETTWSRRLREKDWSLLPDTSQPGSPLIFRIDHNGLWPNTTGSEFRPGSAKE